VESTASWFFGPCFRSEENGAEGTIHRINSLVFVAGGEEKVSAGEWIVAGTGTGALLSWKLPTAGKGLVLTDTRHL